MKVHDDKLELLLGKGRADRSSHRTRLKKSWRRLGSQKQRVAGGRREKWVRKRAWGLRKQLGSKKGNALTGVRCEGEAYIQKIIKKGGL